MEKKITIHPKCTLYCHHQHHQRDGVDNVQGRWSFVTHSRHLVNKCNEVIACALLILINHASYQHHGPGTLTHTQQTIQKLCIVLRRVFTNDYCNSCDKTRSQLSIACCIH